MKNESTDLHPLTLYAGMTLFLLLGVSSLIFFITTLTALAPQVITLSGSVSFDKGAFYLPGIALTIFSLVFLGVYEKVFNNTLSPCLGKVMARIIIGSICLMFLLPHGVEWSLSEYLDRHHYFECEGATRQWLHSKTIIYVADENTCLNLIQKEY